MGDEVILNHGWRRKLLLAAAILPGGVVLTAVGLFEVRVLRLQSALHSPDPVQRTRALDRIATDREARMAAAVHHLLENEQDRGVLEWAGIATLRVGDRRGVQTLRRRADAGPDDAVRAKLIGFAARLSERDLRLVDWLREGSESGEPYRMVGSAVGLLELGLPEGGQRLLEIAATAEPAVRDFAIGEFRRIAEPMSSAVGRPISAWPEEEPGDADAGRWEQLSAFWQDFATIQLLNDILNRLERRDEKWHHVNRLLHARQKAARWLK